MTRARAEQAAAVRPASPAAPRAARGTSDRQAALRAMTGDVKLLVAGLVLVLVAGLAWLALAPPPVRPRPVLGYVEAERPRPASIHDGITPAFKLPWWK